MSVSSGKSSAVNSAPRLSDKDIERAVTVLDGWSGKLTWDLYLSELESVLGHRYTKVAMLNRARIANAWNLAKIRTRSSVKEANSGPRVAGGNVLAEVSLPSTTFSSEARPERAAESLVRAEVATSSSFVFLFEQLLELLVPERDEAPVSRCRHHRFIHGRGDCLGCG